MNYMAQDRPDLPATARVLSQMMAEKKTGSEEHLKRTARHPASHPRVLLMIPRGQTKEPLHVWADSDWVGDMSTSRLCSGGGSPSVMEAQLTAGKRPDQTERSLRREPN